VAEKKPSRVHDLSKDKYNQNFLGVNLKILDVGKLLDGYWGRCMVSNMSTSVRLRTELKARLCNTAGAEATDWCSLSSLRHIYMVLGVFRTCSEHCGLLAQLASAQA
jgi:hypothetical protein